MPFDYTYKGVKHSVTGNSGTLTTRGKYLEDNILVEAQGGGGGGGGVPDSGVFFLDYDGTIVETWDSASVASKTALPDNPSHDRLVADGWNWTLADIKDYIADYPKADVVVGQMYHTASGMTEFDITLTKVTGLTINCNVSGSKNWGDGTTDTLTSHTYADYGDYMITCSATKMPSGSAYNGGVFNSSQSTSNKTRYMCKEARLASNVTQIQQYAFNWCMGLEHISVPTGLEIGMYAFCHCDSLKSATIPNTQTMIFGYAFQDCNALRYASIPCSVTYFSNRVFDQCWSLFLTTIPKDTSVIDGYCFCNCNSLRKLVVGGDITIYTNAFTNCYSLEFCTFGGDVNNVGSQCFGGCYAVKLYDFSNTSVIPSLADVGALVQIPDVCKIIVPDALYDEWIAKTNWSTYADYIYKASEVM